MRLDKYEYCCGRAGSFRLFGLSLSERQIVVDTNTHMTAHFSISCLLALVLRQHLDDMCAAVPAEAASLYEPELTDVQSVH